LHYDRRTALNAGLAISALMASGKSAAAAPPTLSSLMDRPTLNAKPWVRWWWPGGVVTDVELRREIDILGKAGFGGAEIQAFNPAIPNLTADERPKLHDYANDAFFEHMEVVGEEADKAGLKIDYTLGSAWPSGGGLEITPELALIELTPAFTTITAPLSGPVKIKLPTQTRKFGAMGGLDSRNKDPRVADWRDRLQKRSRLIAIVAIPGTAPVLGSGKTYRDSDVVTAGVASAGPGIVITDKVSDNGTLNWTPPHDGTWQIIAFSQFNVDVSVMAGVGAGPQLILDHFNKAAFEAHARHVGSPLGSLKHKDAIRATFIDSLELMADIYWSDDFLDQFAIRRGYDLTPYLPYILQPGWEAPWNPRVSPPYYISDDTGDRVRADYRLTVSDLLIENFWQPFVDWNRRQGHLSRLQAHGGPSDILKSYGLADIPESEDLGANGNTHFLRLARAAGDIYGKKIITCESLCWIGKPYEITPQQWLDRTNFLFVSGINELIMHGFPYALHADAWPGWYPFAPSPFLSGFSSQINEANPLWAAIPTLNGYIQRAQALLQAATNVTPVAVLMTDIGYGSNAGDAQVEVWLKGLLDAGFDYNRINADGLTRGQVQSGKFVTLGKASFEVLVVPPLVGIRPDLAKRITELAKAGLKIVFVDALPQRAEGLFDKASSDALVVAAMADVKTAGATVTASSALSSHLSERLVAANVTFRGPPCLFVEKASGNERLFVFHNGTDKPFILACDILADDFPSQLDPFTGKMVAIEAIRTGKTCQLTLQIEPGAAAFVLFNRKALRKAARRQTMDTKALAAAWAFTATGHGHKGRVIQNSVSSFTLTDLSDVDGLIDFSGETAYTTTFDTPQPWLKAGHEVWLDLGAVHDMASVQVNGKLVGTLISSPFRIDIAAHLKAGPNHLEVHVFNGPNNAMMDAKLPGMKDLKQKPAGLVGPVTLTLKA
jgi:hypothetical protein